MQPVKTPDSNITYTAEADEILDLPARVVETGGTMQIESTWDLTELERELVAEGGQVVLTVWARQPPPAGIAIEAPYCSCGRQMEWSKDVRTFTCGDHVEE